MNNAKRGYVAGQPFRFVSGHQNRNRKWSEDHRQKYVKAMTGYSWPAERGRKISETHKARGIKPSAEAAAKGNANRPKGELSHSWKGGVSFVNGRKCLYIPDHPRAHHNGYVYEHVYLAGQARGRIIDPEEVVHHIDGDYTNNEISNLEVLQSQAEHIRLHRAQGDLL